MVEVPAATPARTAARSQIEPARKPAAAAPGRARPATGSGSRWPWIAAALVLVTSAGAEAWRRARGRASSRRNVAAALAEAERAAARGDHRDAARAWARALHAALAARLGVVGARALTPEELADAEPPEVRAAAELLATLDASRFAARGESAPALDAARVRDAIRAL